MRALLGLWNALLALALAWMTKQAVDDSQYGTATFLALVLLVGTAHNIASGRRP